MAGARPRTSVLRRGLDRLRFAVELLLLRGLRYRLLLAAAIVVLVAVVAGGLVVLLDPGMSSPGEAIWWAFLRLTDPGYLGDDEGMARRSISTVVTVLGYVLFLGLLIAILTQWLNQVISRLTSGVTPVVVSDHVIILGWTHRTHTIISELLRTRNRVERFLARHGARDLRIVILAEEVNEALAQEVRERLGPLWNDRRVLLRAGSPLRLDHLERVGFEDAAAIILPGPDHAERRPEAVDAQVIKTLRSVSRHAAGHGRRAPLAVAELYDVRRAAVARSSYDGQSEIIAPDLIVSRLIAQCVRQRGLWSAFSELLTLNEGNTLYVRDIPELAGTPFGTLRDCFGRAIPLGVVRAEDRAPVLNPEPDAILAEGDLLVCLARSFDHCAPDGPPASPPPPLGPPAEPPAPERRRVLILGWSRKVPALLSELAEHAADAFEIDVVSSVAILERERALSRHGEEATTAGVRQLEAGYTTPGVLEQLGVEGYDDIILLASESLSEEKQVDAITVYAYLMLERELAAAPRRPRLFVELLDEENRFLLDEQEDVIVSPLLGSYLLSQVALRPELAAIYSELSRARGPQMILQPAAPFVSGEAPARFAEIAQAVAARGEIALGLAIDSGPDAGIVLNPDRDRAWTLGRDDCVVVLATLAENGAPATRSDGA